MLVFAIILFVVFFCGGVFWLMGLLIPSMFSKFDYYNTRQKLFKRGLLQLGVVFILMLVATSFVPEEEMAALNAKKENSDNQTTADNSQSIHKSFFERPLSIESVKKLNPDIVEVELHKQVTTDPNQADQYAAYLTFKRDPFWGSKKDWFYISNIYAFEVGKSLLMHPNVKRYVMFINDSSDFQWAQIKVNQDDLPQSADYLDPQQYFGYVTAKGGNPIVYSWLCEYYTEYKIKLRNSFGC